MKKVVWGTGFYASKFVQTIDKEDIAFYIDSDKKKSGKIFYGKKIVHPDNILQWGDLYVYVPFNFYNEISDILKKHGVRDENYTKYYETNSISAEASEKDFKRALQELELNKERMYGKSVFLGRTLTPSRGYKEYIQMWLERDNQLNMGLVSEAVWLQQQETEEETGLPTVVAPKIFDEDLWVFDGLLQSKEIDELTTIPEWEYDVAWIQGKHKDISKASAYYIVYRLYQYLNTMLDILKPRMLVMYASVTVHHKIAAELCQKRNIPFVFTHQGIIPGTFAFDVGGEVGASLPAMYPQKFCELTVSESEKVQAQVVWDYLYKTKMNRKIQPKNNAVDIVKEQLDPKKPTIFFGGQNDILSHMIPYTSNTQKYHSPIFHSSIEAAVYIGELCKKNDWNFIYKPHPMYAEKEDITLLPENTIYVKYGDINELMDEADVFVTILSTANYVGLIRKKPVVMLGYTQSKGKNITYEAFVQENIEQAMKDAVDKGFTKEQQEAFLLHLAQVLKYYLYDDMQEREMRFGKAIPKSIEEFWDLERLLKDTGEN